VALACDQAGFAPRKHCWTTAAAAASSVLPSAIPQVPGLTLATCLTLPQCLPFLQSLHELFYVYSLGTVIMASPFPWLFRNALSISADLY
jgi:hypothetical protein